MLAVVDPEHAWRVRVGPHGPDAARSTPTAVRADEAGPGDHDTDPIVDRAALPATDRPAFTEWEVSVIRAALEHSGPLPDEAERAQGVATAIFDALDPEG